MTEQPPGSARELTAEEMTAEEIERTRAELAQTVQQLVAKTDVKARAVRAASAFTDQLRHQAGELAGQAADRTHQLSSQVTDGMPDSVVDTAQKAASQLTTQAKRYRTQVAAVAVCVLLAGVIIKATAARKSRR